MGTLSASIPLRLSLLFFYRSPVIANRIQRVVRGGSSVPPFIDNFSACVNRTRSSSAGVGIFLPSQPVGDRLKLRKKTSKAVVYNSSPLPTSQYTVKLTQHQLKKIIYRISRFYNYKYRIVLILGTILNSNKWNSKLTRSISNTPVTYDFNAAPFHKYISNKYFLLQFCMYMDPFTHRINTQQITFAFDLNIDNVDNIDSLTLLTVIYLIIGTYMQSRTVTIWRLGQG